MNKLYSLELNKDNANKEITKKKVLGLYEFVKINGKKVLARIDSGAVKSSIDIELAAELSLGPIIGSRIIRNAHGTTHRSLVEVDIELCRKKVKAKFTLQSRKEMKFKVLIGQNVLIHNFIIDPQKNILIKHKKVKK